MAPVSGRSCQERAVGRLSEELFRTGLLKVTPLQRSADGLCWGAKSVKAINRFRAGFEHLK
jgi:hypothetical protein